MALVCYLDNLFVLNVSLAGQQQEGYALSATTPIFSTSALHEMWAEGMVHPEATFERVRFSCYRCCNLLLFNSLFCAFQRSVSALHGAWAQGMVHPEATFERFRRCAC